MSEKWKCEICNDSPDDCGPCYVELIDGATPEVCICAKFSKHLRYSNWKRIPSVKEIQKTPTNTSSPKLPDRNLVIGEFLNWWRSSIMIDYPSAISLCKFYDLIAGKIGH